MKKFISFEFKLMKCLAVLLTMFCVLRCAATTADVKTFGALGDGVTDDTVAIQAAITSGAQTILIPSGTYIISATLYVETQGLNIIGEGADYMQAGGLLTKQQTTLKWAGASGGTILKLYKTRRTTVNGISFCGNNKIAEVGLMLDSDHAPFSLANNIWMCSFDQCQIGLDIGPNDAVTETDVGNCMFFNNTTQIRVSDLDCYDTTIRNTHFYGYTPCDTNYILKNRDGKVSFINCYFGPTKLAVVDQTGIGWIRMTDCYSESHGAYIAILEQVNPECQAMVIDNCTFLQNTVPPEGFIYVPSSCTNTPNIVISNTYSPKAITVNPTNSRVSVTNSIIGNIGGAAANRAVILNGDKAIGQIGSLQGHIAAVGPEARLELLYATAVNTAPDAAQSIVLQNIGSSKLKFMRPGYTNGLTLDFGSYPNQWSHGGAAAPVYVANAWNAVGDIVWNHTPAAGGYIGWVCTAAGNPGTWKKFGAISN